VIPDKGVRTVVEAFALLAQKPEAERLSLTILGDGPGDYLDSLKRVVLEHGMEEVIRFQAAIPRHSMPEALARHAALILASEYDEPLARSIQEAMAMQLVVIGTTTGGSGELLVDERTGLVFQAGDAKSLAHQLAKAAQDPELVQRLSLAGRRAVEEQFDIQKR
jgi:colanic acid/amylovoran biosynthesis glycosyltransferase